MCRSLKNIGSPLLLLILRVCNQSRGFSRWLLYGVGITLLVGCGKPQPCGLDVALELGEKPLTWRERHAVEKVKQLIMAPKAWTDLSQSEIAEQEKLLDAMEQVRQYDLRVVRQAVYSLYCQATSGKPDRYDTDMASRLMLLNRYYFNVQTNSVLQSAFGDWLGVPFTGTNFSVLWPLSIRADGKIVIGDQGHGYSGEPHRAMEEFLVFEKTFGVRKRLK